MENSLASRGRVASKLWFYYTIATVVVSLLVLAIFVNAYDNTGVTARLSAMANFTRTAMRVLSFPLGLPSSAADPFLQRSFACDAQSEPCATFIDWWTHFGALVLQIALLRWIVGRL